MWNIYLNKVIFACFAHYGARFSTSVGTGAAVNNLAEGFTAFP